jgi:hypothetical protein
MLEKIDNCVYALDALVVFRSSCIVFLRSSHRMLLCHVTVSHKHHVDENNGTRSNYVLAGEPCSAFTAQVIWLRKRSYNESSVYLYVRFGS